MNETYELRLFSNTAAEWEKLGMKKFLQLATTDIFEAPSVAKLTKGVDFINDIVGKKHALKNMTRFSLNTSCF